MSNESRNNEAVNNEDSIQYLTFILDGDTFATDITQVREVLEHTEVMKVPNTPYYMQGVINLRGSVVPVVDLRAQFGMETAEVTVDTCIIIIDVNIERKPVVLGALADSVREVIDLRTDQMEPAPTLGARVNNEFIKAMAKTSENNFIMVLDMDKVFSAKQIQEVEKNSVEQSETSNTEAA